MNFRAWLLTEIGDIENLNADHIHLTTTPHGYEYLFNIAEQEYKVTFNVDHDLEFQEKKIPGSYVIFFTGPNHYNTTNLGTNAHKVYTQLLLAVKKLFQTTEVNGLAFHPTEAAMASVYQRFFKRFLQKDFMAINSTDYIRKSYIKELLQDQPNKAKKTAYKDILQQHRDAYSLRQHYQDQRHGERKLRLAIPRLLNQVVYLDNHSHWILGLITKVNNNFVLATIHDEGQVKQMPFNFSQVQTEPLPNEIEQQNFLKTINKI